MICSKVSAKRSKRIWATSSFSQIKHKSEVLYLNYMQKGYHRWSERGRSDQCKKPDSYPNNCRAIEWCFEPWGERHQTESQDGNDASHLNDLSWKYLGKLADTNSIIDISTVGEIALPDREICHRNRERHMGILFFYTQSRPNVSISNIHQPKELPLVSWTEL